MNRKTRISWALYDWANSAFATTVMAGFFPVFFKEYWASDLSATDSTFWLGLGNSVASVLMVLFAPLIGALWIGAPLACLLEMAISTEVGVHSVLWLLLVVKGNDSGAYLIGRRFGKTPLSSLSPKKTVEGALGGLLVGGAIGYGYFQFVPIVPLGPLGAMLMAISMGVCGQLGDLVESGVKRALGVKDSGRLVPTYGGALDMVDSLLLASPVLLLVIKTLEDSWSS